MYAVIETGGKQHIVQLGSELEVELLDVEPGQEITLDRVLLVVDGEQTSVGRPLVTEAAVSARVLRQTRGDKVISFKYRPKARRRVKKGHRQELTVLRITDVRLGDRSAAGEASEAAERARTDRERVAEAAARQAAEDAALAAKLAERTRAAAAPDEAEPETPPARRRSRAPGRRRGTAKPADTGQREGAEATSPASAPEGPPAAEAAAEEPVAEEESPASPSSEAEPASPGPDAVSPETDEPAPQG